MKLSGPEQKELRDALLDAFPTFDDLQAMVSFALNEDLEPIAGSKNLKTVVFKLIQFANARDKKLERLIMGAYAENPDNLQLKAM